MTDEDNDDEQPEEDLNNQINEDIRRYSQRNRKPKQHPDFVSVPAVHHTTGEQLEPTTARSLVRRRQGRLERSYAKGIGLFSRKRRVDTC